MLEGVKMVGIVKGLWILSDIREFLAKLMWFFGPCLGRKEMSKLIWFNGLSITLQKVS